MFTEIIRVGEWINNILGEAIVGSDTRAGQLVLLTDRLALATIQGAAYVTIED
jgi:hypothetical protein